MAATNEQNNLIEEIITLERILPASQKNTRGNLRMKDEIEIVSNSGSSRHLRNRQTMSSKREMRSSDRENRSRSSRPGRPSVAVPLVIILVCMAIFAGSPLDYLYSFRQHRTLLTLTPEHVNQYPFSNFLEVSQHQPVTQRKAVGFYWQIPRCGGTTLKHILGTCLRQAAAARTSADYCDMNTDVIQTCPTKVGTFVNADPSDHGGIQRCERMGLIKSGIPDVIVSSRILHAATLFDPDHKGRLFTILRNPIERAVSTFFYLQNAYWERHYRPELKEMTILDYAALPDTANNWMTRWLTGKNAEPHLTEEDLTFAKELLRRKFLILLTDEMGTSIERLLYYMNWKIPEEHFEETRQCLLANTQKDQGQNRNKHLMPEQGSPEYEALKAINNLDLQLFEYAQDLFKEQEEVIMKRKHKRTSELFIPNDTTSSTSTDAISKASQSSGYEAARAAAALMERPPEGSAMKSVEATNNLVATALMIKLNSTVPILKEGSAMIASAMAKRQGSTNKWDQFRGVATPYAGVSPQLPQVQATTSSTEQKQSQSPQTTSTAHAHNQAAQQEGGSESKFQAVVPASQEGAPEAHILEASNINGAALQSLAQATPLIQQEQSMLHQTNQAAIPQQIQQQVLQQEQPHQAASASSLQQQSTSQVIQQQPERASSQMQSGSQTMQQQQQPQQLFTPVQ